MDRTLAFFNNKSLDGTRSGVISFLNSGPASVPSDLARTGAVRISAHVTEDPTPRKDWRPKSRISLSPDVNREKPSLQAGQDPSNKRSSRNESRMFAES